MAGFTAPKTSDLALERKVLKASAVLGLENKKKFFALETSERSAYKQIVLEAFRKIAKEAHPDSNLAAPQGIDYTIQNAREAKDFLIKYLEEADEK